MSTILWLKPDDVLVDAERQRKTFNEVTIKALAESIKSTGQINPIVVEQVNGHFHLRAGERRLRAGRLLAASAVGIKCGGAVGAPGLVPCLASGDLDPLARYALELEENIQREDLTWQERATALTRFHELRRAQTGGTQSFAATADEIGHTAPITISEAFIVTRHLADPEVAKAKTQKEAVKIIQKKAEVAHRAILAQKFDMTKTEHTMLNGDVYEVLPGLPDSRFDCIITDPPYGVGADNFGSQSGVRHTYEDSEEYVGKLIDFITEQYYRLAKPEAFLYLFCDIRWFDRISLAATLAGWNVWRKPLIWNKLGSGMLPEPDFGPRYTYECILYARKGNRKVIKTAAPDVLSHAPVRGLVHGAQKPVAVYVDLLSRVCLPGQEILDSFGGSGPVLVAANILRLRATYVEKDEVHFNSAKLRVNSKELDNGTGAGSSCEGLDQGVDGELVIPGLDG